MCERCSLWICVKCSEIEPHEFKILHKNQKLHWFCGQCEEKANEAIKMDRKIEECISSHMERIEKKLTSIEKKINEKADKQEVQALEAKIVEIENKISENKEIPEEEVQETIDNAIDNKILAREEECREREKRKNSMVVFGMEETEEKNTDEKIRFDTDAFTKLMEEDLGVAVLKEEIKAVFRLGKNNDDNKPRPMKVVLREAEKKREIFKSMHKLKREKKIQIIHDLTHAQREERKQLEAEAAKKSQDSQGKDVYRVRGPPWAWHIKKVGKDM